MMNVNSIAAVNEDTFQQDDEVMFYISGLFSIETSPAFKSIDALKGKPGVTEAK